ncbi:MAG: Gfo/Idh/MocA family oxidoreductase [Clostridiales bacterium]|nr:Gfo/Idh/MocA family oxidoreductase [Clostridiales bacterium]
MKVIRFGMIGAGSVAEKKSAPALQKTPGSSLVAVMRRDAVKLQDYARRHGIARYSTQAKDILEAPDIDAVYIATPPGSHCSYTLEAALKGKAVYVEKPMARTVQEARQMVDTCKKAGVPLFVAYYRRAQPRFLKAKELIDSGALGEVRSFTYQYACPVPEDDPLRPWLLTRKDAGGGLLYDIGSHMVDSIIFMLGQPKEVIGRTDNLSQARETADQSSALMRFESGVQGSLQLSFNVASRLDRLFIMGTRGSLTMSIMGYEPLILEREGVLETLPYPQPEHVQSYLITRVVNTLRGLDNLDSTGRSALQTQEILEAIDNSAMWVYQGE